MKRNLWIMMVVVIFWSSGAWANGVDPDRPIDFVPYPNTALIDPEVSVEVIYNSTSDTFTYSHAVYIKPSSALPLFSFEVLTEAEILNKQAPPGLYAAVFQDGGQAGPFSITYGPRTEESTPQPGGKMEDCVAVSTGFPSVAVTLIQGDVVPPSGQQVILPPTEAQGPVTWETGKVKVMSVGPFKRPQELNPTDYAEFIIGEADKALPLGWLQSSLGISGALSSIRAKVSAGQDVQAAEDIIALLAVLKVERGQGVTDNGYFLLRPNLERLLSLMGGVPSEVTLTVSKDALVYEKSPHSNEGANPRLSLEKINGKAARNLLGFDLSGVATNSLTSATLVLSIDPSDQVTGWGNGETVTVKPVAVAWQEGNGKKHGLPSHQQTTGSGAGTTWFSPIDENISNNSSNSVVQWTGAAAYATTGTAPPLTVHNHQSGELRFDVTQDVLNGVTHGWLLRKDAESKGSKVSFYSREGGGANLVALRPGWARR